MFTRRMLQMAVSAVLFAVALLLATTSAWAKGDFNKVVVYGDGAAVESFDSSLMAFEAFNSFSNPYPGTPSVTIEGYLVVRYARDQRTGEYIAVDSLRFFPRSLSSGSKPFVYYEGLVNGWTEYDHKWYEAKPEAAAALQRLMDSEAKRSSAWRLPLSAMLALSGLAGIAIGVIAMTLVRGRRPGHVPADNANSPPRAA